MRPVLVFRVTITRLHMLCRSAFRSDGFTAPTLGPEDWHDAQMTTLARMIGQGRSWWYTTAFWLVFVVCLYLALLMADWWWLILVALNGVTINYCWWSVERVQHKFRVVFSAVLGGFTLLVLAVAGWLVLHTISVPLDSVGERRAVCGSMLNPLPADQLRATESRSGEPTLEADQVSTIRLQQICDRRIRYWAGDLPGVLIVALLLSSRAAGHLTVRRPA